MRHTARFLTLLILSLFFVIIEDSAQAAPELKKLTDRVYAFIGEEGGTNSGFVVTDSGVVVIDTQGPRGLALDLRKRIKEVTELPVIYVINTHYHGDHTFGNQYFREALAIISHEETRSLLIEKDEPHRARFKGFFGEDSLDEFTLTLPEITFSDRLVLRAGSTTFEIVHTPPAHTYGDAYVYVPGEDVVFTGDLLYKGRLPWLHDGVFSGALKAVDELIGLNASRYVPGHGDVAAKEGLLEYKKYLLDLDSEVRRLKGLGKGAEEIKKEISLPAYEGYLMYREWLPLNAEKVYMELSGEE